jgi:integrase
VVQLDFDVRRRRDRPRNRHIALRWFKLPEIPHHKHYIPSAEQVHGLAAAVDERYRPIVYLAAGCGFRGAEITGLEVDAVDFLRREIDITQQLVCVTGQEPYRAAQDKDIRQDRGPSRRHGRCPSSAC